MAGIYGLYSTPASKLVSISGCCPLMKYLSNPPSHIHFSKLPRGGRIMARLSSGGYRPGPGGGSRRSSGNSRLADSDYDPALDLDRVKSASVRLLDEQQNMVGIVSKSEAILMAKEAELILAKDQPSLNTILFFFKAILSADADPPVLRLFESADYKKHKYEQQKKKRVQMKRSAANRMDIKELKMSYNIDSHDYSVRLKAAKKFLNDGDKVKVMVSLKGRENEFRSIAIELIKRFQNDVGELGTEESKNLSDRNIFMVLMPNKVALQKVREQPKKDTTATEVSTSV